MRGELTRMTNRVESLKAKENESKEEILGLKEELNQLGRREENMVSEREKGKSKIESLVKPYQQCTERRKMEYGM